MIRCVGWTQLALLVWGLSCVAFLIFTYNCGKNIPKTHEFYHLKFLRVWYSIVNNKHNDVEQISRTFPSCTTETSYPLNSNFPSTFSWLLATSIPLSASVSLNTSHEYYLDKSYISGIMHYLSFCDWLTSLSIISSRFIHIVK